MVEKKKKRSEIYKDSYFVQCESCGFKTHVSVQGHNCVKCHGNMVKVADPVGKRM